MKKYILLAILALIGAGIFCFAVFLEPIVKKAVNKYGSEVTGTDINISGFKLSPLDGKVTIHGLTVANPKGYAKPYLFSLDRISVTVDLKSLMTDTIIVKEIIVDRPAVTYEMVSVTKNNVSDILKNIDQHTAKGNAGAEKAKAEPAKQESGKRVIINKVLVNEGEVTSAVSIQGKSSSISAKLPSITLKDIGKESKGSNGESIVSAVGTIFSKILNAAMQAVVSGKLGDYQAMAKENLNNVVDSVKERVKIKGIFNTD